MPHAFIFSEKISVKPRAFAFSENGGAYEGKMIFIHACNF